MALTHTYADALNFIRPQAPAVAEDQKAAMICNIGTNIIWNMYDWRETIERLPSFWLTPWEQDYGAPLVVVPSDFMGLRTATLVDMASNPAARWPMKVMKYLEPTHSLVLPKTIAYEPSIPGFRVFPRTPNGLGSGRFKVDGTYKKRPELVTASTYTALPLPFDDLYFQVWIEVLRWATFSATGNPNAGAATVSPSGQVVYSGQLGTAMAMINRMAANEGFNLGETTVAPSEPLSIGGDSWAGRNFLFGA